MSEDLWNFAGTEAGSRDILDLVATMSSQLDDGKRSLEALSAVWGGTTSLEYQQVQLRWDTTSAELTMALQNLAHTVTGSG